MKKHTFLLKKDSSKMADNIIVSVFVHTFNQAQYIQQCLYSILYQECSFDFEILVHDDSSTDGTSELIRDIAKEFPEKIIHKRQDFNTYHHPERYELWSKFFSKARGDFIAICNGDDYWVSNDKLQCQYDLMTNEEELSFCYHNIEILKNNRLTSNNHFKNGYVATCDLISNKWFVPSSSLFYRKKHLNNALWTGYIPNEDLGWLLELSLHGRGFGINNVFGVYRSASGVSNRHRVSPYGPILDLSYSLSAFNVRTGYEFRREIQNYLNDRLDETMTLKFIIKTIVSYVFKKIYSLNQ